ncbi:hypothetical protein ACET3X_000664 [Alternaria dauci]|uniref:Anaphase-promoting complex subunit 1 n=1 Tax=Alternaria dauci TaxID=48095 RepID=A0ABR3UVL8_9PLEO
MASLRSIGVHKPSALQYLVQECILAEDSTDRDYVWDTYADDDDDAQGPTDELVTTEYHVVWSRGGVIRKVFNFEVEKEKVKQALLTWFPVDEPSQGANEASHSSTEYTAADPSKTFLTQGTQPAAHATAPANNTSPTAELLSRALVVFLKSQAHVFFLSGTTHIVNLPFEVDKAFPAARGLVVQRKLAPLHPVPTSPLLPSAPPNSFLTTNQSFLSQHFSVSQSFSKPHRRHGSSIGASRHGKSRLSGATTFLDELVPPPNPESIPRLYSFTDPLSELGLVVNVVSGGDRSSLLTSHSSSHRKLEAIDKAEEIIYVSPRNELLFDRSGNDKPLLLVVTANHETNVFTIWSAAYLEPKSISTSRKQHVSLPVSKSRRRSSYGGTAPGTGATTPAIRGADRLRESFGGAPRSKAQLPSFKITTKERLSDQAVDDALASQLNPDSDITRQPKESRRVSSLLSRAELSTSFDKSAFQDLATSRTSIGGSFNASFSASQRSRHSLGHDRTSFGGFSQSRNRASTPGSVTSRMSLGAVSIDDTLDDAMDEDTFDTIEDYDELDDLFAPPDAKDGPRPGDGLLKELVISVIAEIPVTEHLKSGLFALGNPSNTPNWHELKVLTLNAPFNSATLHERKLYLYISHPSLQLPLECDFLLEIWWNIRKALSDEVDEHITADWTAFVATLFTLVVPFIDEKKGKINTRAKSTQRRSSGRPASQAKPDELIDDEDSAWRLMCSRQISTTHPKSWESSPWAWALHSSPKSATMSPLAKRDSMQHQLPTIAQQISVKDNMVPTCLELARQFVQSPVGKATNDHWRRHSPSEKQDLRISSLSEIVVSLHLFREERKLDTLCQGFVDKEPGNLAPVLAQIGHWLRWEGWDWRQGGFFDLDGGSGQDWAYDETILTSKVRLHAQPWDAPPSILEWLGTVTGSQHYAPFPTLAMLIRKSKASPHSSINIDEIMAGVTPRTVALHRFFRDIDPTSNPKKIVELIKACDISPDMLATLPEAAKAPLMEAITRCQANPPTTWSSSLLRLIQREDLDIGLAPIAELAHDAHLNAPGGALHATSTTRDVHTICQGADRMEAIQSTSEVERHYITRLIFREDRRFMEAYTLLEPLRQTVAEYKADSRQDDAAMLEGQKALMQWVMVRTFSLPLGSSMIKFSSKKPLLTEKYPLYGFSTSCLMKPMGNVVTAERQNYSEEKYFWAFFNAGAAAGLSISRDAQGIDTSWIMYNKPAELTNKHAGLLLGLGLNGHLRTIAKWLSFKYLTPKHTMTSVGLLLGLAASFMGTMDTLVTRLLSVHVTRMLPQGAAELNLSPYTQTTGLMGIGLLYYNTQHRRMSEVMLSEIEYVEIPDPSEPPDSLRDEAYRLAAGFALGFINLGKGKDLRGLHDMRIVERLMAVAVAPKPVNVVHILDQATAGAVIAVALIFMKTHDQTVARKIDIPDTLPQFDYVRPDIFLLRTLAKHLIMWDDIEASDSWIIKNMPYDYREAWDLKGITRLRSEQMPFYNILAGLLWAVSLKHAGTGDTQVRDFLIKYLDQLIRINKLAAVRYDSKLSKNTVRNCQDLIALAAATVMAGTGDLDVFRRLRGLHGRIGPDIPYGSHLAAHMAFGTLFIAGGTQTFSRSNKAIASLICAFYPLFPSDVQDSRAHLQAFRHFWVLAAEPRCLVVRDVDTGRAISMPITVVFKNTQEGNQQTATKTLVAPCLLPEIHLISRLETADQTYWPTILDFVHNPLHLKSFMRNQTLNVRRRSAHDTYATPFSATLVALNDAQSSKTANLLFHWVFTLPALSQFISASDAGLILPLDQYSKSWLDPGATVVESRLVLGRLAKSWKVEELRELKGVFEWADAASRQNGQLGWLGREIVERIKAGVMDRGRAMGA